MLVMSTTRKIDILASWYEFILKSSAKGTRAKRKDYTGQALTSVLEKSVVIACPA